MSLPPLNVIAGLVVVFAVGLYLLLTSSKRSTGEYVGAVLTLVPVGTFILLIVMGVGQR